MSDSDYSVHLYVVGSLQTTGRFHANYINSKVLDPFADWTIEEEFSGARLPEYTSYSYYGRLEKWDYVRHYSTYSDDDLEVQVREASYEFPELIFHLSWTEWGLGDDPDAEALNDGCSTFTAGEEPDWA